MAEFRLVPRNGYLEAVSRMGHRERVAAVMVSPAMTVVTEVGPGPSKIPAPEIVATHSYVMSHLIFEGWKGIEAWLVARFGHLANSDEELVISWS